MGSSCNSKHGKYKIQALCSQLGMGNNLGLPCIYDALLLIRPECIFREGLTIKNVLKTKRKFFEEISREESIIIGIRTIANLTYQNKLKTTVLKIAKNENIESSHTEVELGLASALILVKSYANWLIVELNQICYGGILRTIALGFTEGISSWKVEALCTSQALVVPVGRSTLGRLFNVLGANIDAYIGLNELPIYAEGPTNFEEVCEQTTGNLQRVYHSQIRENKREIQYPNKTAST